MTEVFYAVLPSYLLYGMTTDEFWHGDVRLTEVYRERHRLSLVMQNEMAWLQGRYIHDAFAVIMHNAFSKKGAKAEKYPESPYPLFDKPKPKREEVEEGKKQRQAAVDALNQLIAIRKAKQGGDKKA